MYSCILVYNVKLQRSTHFFRSLKYECVYLREYETGSELRRTLSCWFDCYNAHRPLSVFNGRKPMEIYQNELPEGVPPLAGLKKAA